MSKEKKAGEKIERTPAEVAKINKTVDKMRSEKGEKKEIEVDMSKKDEVKEMSKKDFKALIAEYKEQSPVKYEAKKEAFERKLKRLK